MKNVIFFVLFASTPLFSQEKEPIEIVKELVLKENSKKLNLHFTGEFKGHPNKEDFGKDKISNIKKLSQTDKRAVVNVTIQYDKNEGGVDVYYHLIKEEIWKIEAFRALALTSIPKRILGELEKINPEELDSLLKYQDPDYAIFETVEDFNFQLNNTRLLLNLDDEIMRHFHENRAAFYKLRADIFAFYEDAEYFGENFNEVFKNNINDLFIGSLSANKIDDGILKFTIGGMLDNTVGYFYFKDELNVPEPNPNNIIMIRGMGDGWYMFKTT